jgi:hypothetical protein
MFSNIFNQQGRIGSDMTDQTQSNLQNTQHLNRMLNHYFSDSTSNSHIQFATQYPGLMVSGINGGLGLGASVEDESSLFWNSKQERSLEKMQLNARPFVTIPYLGRGSCDPIVESQLLMGEPVRGKKSVSTVMEDSFNPLEDYPLEKGKDHRTVEESALNGWVRGGTTSRESGDKYFSQKSRPTDLGF